MVNTCRDETIHMKQFFMKADFHSENCAVYRKNIVTDDKSYDSVVLVRQKEADQTFLM